MPTSEEDGIPLPIRACTCTSLLLWGASLSSHVRTSCGAENIGVREVPYNIQIYETFCSSLFCLIMASFKLNITYHTRAPKAITVYGFNTRYIATYLIRIPDVFTDRLKFLFIT